MVVIATAGHVDHGKSTLVRALTGMEPDRWEEERRRELTIDLGYAWSALPSGRILSFVDVPGHSRFIGNMLAGLGPVPAVLLVVAADAGWSAQTEEHVQAIDALGVRHGILVVTRADRADPTMVLRDSQERLASTSLGSVDAVAVSALTGGGVDQLRSLLDEFVAQLETAGVPPGRTRLWVDRSFAIRGAGTVVTGTLGEGEIRVGDELTLTAADGVNPRRVTVRGLQSLERDVESLAPVTRAAVNLRGVAASDIGRGAVLVDQDAWRTSAEFDVALRRPGTLPRYLQLHVGTASIEARVRPLSQNAVRLRLRRPLPLTAGDRAILRNPGNREVVGIEVVDVDPPPLMRRGAARQRADDLAAAGGAVSLAGEVRRRGHFPIADARRLGFVVPEPLQDAELLAWPVPSPRLLIHDDTWSRWVAQTGDQADLWRNANPMTPRMPLAALTQTLGLPDPDLARALADAAGLQLDRGKAFRPGVVADLGPGERAMAGLEERLRREPFLAPTADDLTAVGLNHAQVRAAVADGRLLRLADDALVAPSAPALAMRELSQLPQPFTVSQARQALGTTRRVAVPLLELLDQRGWTRRVDPTHREIVR